MPVNRFVKEVLARREQSLDRIEGLAEDMRQTFLGIRREAQRIVNRNLRSFQESGRYVDSADARRVAERTVAEVNDTLRRGLSGAQARLSDAKIRQFRQSALDLSFSLETSTGQKLVTGGSFGQLFDEMAERASRTPILGVAADRQLARTGRWAGQRYREAITQGVIQGQGADDVAKRIKRIGDTTEGAAKRIARNNLNQVSNDAHRAVYEANDDVFIGYKWDSTFDSRTSAICARLHGTFYPLGSKPPGPPAHHNCRSLLVGVFKDPDLENAASAAPRRVRTYDSQGDEIKPKPLVSANQSFEEWMRGQPSAVTERITGSEVKDRLWRSNRIGLDDIVNDELKELSDKAVLRRAWAYHPDDDTVAALAKVEGLERPVSVDTIIREDLRMRNEAEYTLGTRGMLPSEMVQASVEGLDEEAIGRRVRSLQSKQSRARKQVKDLEGQLAAADSPDTAAAIQRRIAAEQKKIDEAGAEIKSLRSTNTVRPAPPPPATKNPIDPPPQTALREANDAMTGDAAHDYVVFDKSKNALDDPRVMKLFEELSEAAEVRALTAAEEELLLVLTTNENQVLVFKGDDLLSGLVWKEKDGAMFIEHFGSVGKGGGSRAIHKAMRDALSRGMKLTGQSTDDAVGFYRSIGWKLDDANNFSVGSKELERSLGITSRRIRPNPVPATADPVLPTPSTFADLTPDEVKRKLASVQSSMSRRRGKVKKLKVKAQGAKGAEQEKLLVQLAKENDELQALERQKEELSSILRTGKGKEIDKLKRRKLDQAKPTDAVGATAKKAAKKKKTSADKVVDEVARKERKAREIEQEFLEQLAEVEELEEAIKRPMDFNGLVYGRMKRGFSAKVQAMNKTRKKMDQANASYRTAERKLFSLRREGKLDAVAPPLGKKPPPLAADDFKGAIAKAKEEMEALGLTEEVMSQKGPSSVLDALRRLKGTGLNAQQRASIDKIASAVVNQGSGASPKETKRFLEILETLLESTDDSIRFDKEFEEIFVRFWGHGRAGAQKLENRMYFNRGGEMVKEYAHEYAHHMQFRNERLRQRVTAWMESRTEGEEFGQLFHHLNRGHERGRKDQFYDPYVGRQYAGDQSTGEGAQFEEGFSMGVETLFNHERFRQILQRDPDHLRLIWAMLRGY